MGIEWYAIYYKGRASHGAFRNDAYRTFFRTRNNEDARALAKALNSGEVTCRGSIAFSNNCGKCAKCRYSF